MDGGKRDVLPESERVVEHRSKNAAQSRYENGRPIAPQWRYGNSLSSVFSNLACPGRKPDSDQHNYNSGQNRDHNCPANVLSMLEEKRNQRPQKRPQSDHNGICESKAQAPNRDPEEHLPTCHIRSGFDRNSDRDHDSYSDRLYGFLFIPNPDAPCGEAGIESIQRDGTIAHSDGKVPYFIEGDGDVHEDALDAVCAVTEELCVVARAHGFTHYIHTHDNYGKRDAPCRERLF
jgi:hypothetical protein